MQISEPHPRPTESESLGIGPEIWILMSPPGDSVADWNLRSPALERERVVVKSMVEEGWV